MGVENGLQIIGRNQGAKIRFSKNKIAKILFKCPICKKKSEVHLFCSDTRRALLRISINQYTQLVCQSCQYFDGSYIIHTQNQKFDKDGEPKSFFKMRKAYKKLGWID